MTDFGKLNFSTSFNPTSAFPLDARCYFESLTDAKKAASSAKAVGDTSTVYHYGMKLLVYEGGVYTWYQISKNNELIAEATRDVSLPTPIDSEAKMNSILANATEADIGTIYKFTGESTLTYEKNALYMLTGEVLDGDGVSH